MALTEQDWRSLVLRAVDDDGTVNETWNSLWARRAYLDDADTTGELRFLAIVLDALDLLLAKAAPNVNTSEGGQSGSWAQYFDHLVKLREQYQTQFQALATSIVGIGGMAVGVMDTTSLTPVEYPGYQPDPASPGYMGDPRYHRGWPL